MFLFDQLPGIAATPQLLAFIRDVHYPGPKEFMDSYYVANERILARKIGVNGIEDWLERDFPMPIDILAGEIQPAL